MGLAEPKGGGSYSEQRFHARSGLRFDCGGDGKLRCLLLAVAEGQPSSTYSTEVIGAPQHPSLGRLFRCFQCVDCFAQCSFLETYHNLPHLNSIDAFRFVFLDVSGISSLPGAALSTIEPTTASDRTL